MKYIGVFDSGVGGLSILKSLISSYPHENFVYIGDTARLPYGTKSRSTIKNYVQRNIAYLKDHYDLKAIVVACNTASTVLDEVHLGTNTIGVIKAGCIAALDVTQNKKVGLWATKATVNSKSYESFLIKNKIQTFSVPCSMLVTAVEEGAKNPKILHPLFEHYFTPLEHENVDTLILGCTHFPFLKGEINQYFKDKNLNITTVDASQTISQKLATLSLNNSNEPGQNILLITDDAPHFLNFINQNLSKDINFETKTINI